MHLLRGEEELPAAEGFVWLAREGSSASRRPSLEALATRQHVAGGLGHVACSFRRAPAAGSSLLSPQGVRALPYPLVCLDLGWNRFLGLRHGELSGLELLPSCKR